MIFTQRYDNVDFFTQCFFFFCLAMIGIEMKEDFLGRGEGGGRGIKVKVGLESSLFALYKITFGGLLILHIISSFLLFFFFSFPPLQNLSQKKNLHLPPPTFMEQDM